MKLTFNIMILVFVVMSMSGIALAADDGPVAHWKFDKLTTERIRQPFEEEEEEHDPEEIEAELAELQERIQKLREEIAEAEEEDKEGLEREMRGLRREAREFKEMLSEIEEDEDEDEDDDEDDDDADDEDEDADEEEEEEYETIRVSLVFDDAGDVEDHVKGAFFRLVEGVSGKALQLDGNSSYIVREGEAAPKIEGDFAVQGWVALGAYPTHWCPIADYSSEADKGYFLGIDALGHAGFNVSIQGKWHEIQSEQRIPLRKWTHIAGVYNPSEGMSLYVDGKCVGSKKVSGEFSTPAEANMLIGRHSIMRKPYGTLRPNATAAVYTFYDGLIDELMVYNRALSAEEIGKYVSKNKPEAKPALSERPLPSGPAGAGKFGAIYTTLKYYDAWDSPWRVGNHADVVVRFDETPCRFVFWRGTSYIPHWVTENGIWYDNEFNETWSEKGCHEPMSDKRCHFSHVRVIESNEARVVVHWRYALVDNWYEMAKVDELTGWGDWTDEVFTIYPDMVAVREVTLHSSDPASPHEWHEGIIVMGPGQRPEQVLNPDALTLANMKGETYVYSWLDGPPGEDGDAKKPENANIHWVNTKSKYKPLVIVSPDSDPAFDIYAGELRREVSMFPWWNHWPTAQKPCDGRYAWDSDLASHSSLSHCYWKPYSETEDSMTKIMLNGLTEKKAAELVPLAKSWARPAKLKIKGGDFSGGDYDPTERAYQIMCKKNGKPSTLNFEVAASKDSPIVNPAFVIKGWGQGNATIKMDGKTLKQSKDCRTGHRHRLEGTDLIVWLRSESTKPVKFTITPD